MEWRSVVAMARWIYERRTYYLYQGDVNQCRPAARGSTGYRIVACDRGNLTEMQAIIHHFPAYVAARVQQGDRAFFVLQGDEWISRMMVVSGPQTYAVLGCALPLGPTAVYLHGLATVEAYQGNGVASALVAHVLATLAEEGATTLYAVIAVRNSRSRRIFDRLQCHCVGVIHSRRAWGRWRSHLRRHANATLSPR